MSHAWTVIAWLVAIPATAAIMFLSARPPRGPRQ